MGKSAYEKLNPEEKIIVDAAVIREIGAATYGITKQKIAVAGTDGKPASTVEHAQQSASHTVEQMLAPDILAQMRDNYSERSSSGKLRAEYVLARQNKCMNVGGDITSDEALQLARDGIQSSDFNKVVLNDIPKIVTKQGGRCF
ncbi:MAG: hypothetical protein ACKVOE_08575 [Rickettsiales bacterium]